MSDELQRKLQALGRALAARAPEVSADEVIERAALRRLEPTRPRRWLVFGGTAAACFLAGVGTAAAVNSLSADEVARGLPGAASIFEGTGPSCQSLERDLFLCVLDYPPAPELIGSVGAGSEPSSDDAEVFVDPIAVFVDDEQIVTGGCAAVTSDNLRWLCAARERAVEYGYVARELLGTRLPGVGVG